MKEIFDGAKKMIPGPYNRWPNDKVLKRDLTELENCAINSRSVAFNNMTIRLYDILAQYNLLTTDKKLIICHRLYKTLCGISDFDYYKLNANVKIKKPYSNLIAYNLENTLKNKNNIPCIADLPSDVNITLTCTTKGYNRIRFDFNNGVSRQMRLHNNSGVIRCSQIAIECEEPHK